MCNQSSTQAVHQAQASARWQGYDGEEGEEGMAEVPPAWLLNADDATRQELAEEDAFAESYLTVGTFITDKGRLSNSTWHPDGQCRMGIRDVHLTMKCVSLLPTACRHEWLHTLAVSRPRLALHMQQVCKSRILLWEAIFGLSMLPSSSECLM